VAFTKLKHTLTTTPILILSNFFLSFVVETDASGTTIGAILSQDGHPIAFFSKKFYSKMQVSSIYVREMLTVTEVEKKWHHYLIGTHFKIIMDQQSLKDYLPMHTYSITTKVGHQTIGVKFWHHLQTRTPQPTYWFPFPAITIHLLSHLFYNSRHPYGIAQLLQVRTRSKWSTTLNLFT